MRHVHIKIRGGEKLTVNLEKFLFGLLGTRNYPQKTDSGTLLKLLKKFQNLETEEAESIDDLVSSIVHEQSNYTPEEIKARSRHILKPYLLGPVVLSFPEMDWDVEERKFWDSTESDLVASYVIPDYMKNIKINTELQESTSDYKNVKTQSTVAKPKGRVQKIKSSDWF